MTEKEVEDYATNFNNIVSSGFITLAVALGNNVGLFEVLKSLQEPADSQTIADRASLKERYVREWLGCMVASKIVFMDGDDKYYIPPKFKDSLEMTWYAPFMTLLGNREEAIEKLFQKDSDKGLDAYDGVFGGQFYDWQDKEWMVFVDDRLDKGILPTVRKYIGKLDFALDVGCGGGVLSTTFAKRYPEATISAIDPTEDAIRRAKNYAQQQNVTNAEFFKYDVTSLPAEWEGRFDLVLAFDVLHDLPDPVASIAEMKRVVKADGILMFIDPKLSSYHRKNAGDMLSGAYYAISIYNCLPQSLSAEPAAGLGVGWGTEKEEAFLKSQNLKIVELSDFTINEYCNNFVCKKINNETITQQISE